MSASCEHPVPFDELIAYHLGELDESDAERIESHYFGCGHCSARLEVVSQLDAGVSALVHAGGLMASSTMALVERARAQGIVVREYRTGQGEHVDCTAGPEDVLLVTRYGGLEGVTSVDVHFRGAIVGTDQSIEMQMQDVPVDQRTGDLVLVAPGGLNRSFPPLEIEIRLTAHGDGGSRAAGPYYYHHRPWELLDDAERQRRAGR
jgi:hypothetical protein